MEESTTQKDAKEKAPSGPGPGTFTIEIDGKKCHLRPLDRTTFKLALGMVSPGMKEPRYVDAGQLILNTCWLDGDEELKDDKTPANMPINVSACLKACEMIEIKEGELKKN